MKLIGIQNPLEFEADTDTEDEGDRNLTGLISVSEIHSEAEFTYSKFLNLVVVLGASVYSSVKLHNNMLIKSGALVNPEGLNLR